MPLFNAISVTLAKVLECFVCNERSGLCRVYAKLWYKCVGIKTKKSADKQQEKIRLMLFEGLHAD